LLFRSVKVFLFVLFSFFLFLIYFQTPIVYAYIAYQLHLTNAQFKKILTAKDIDMDALVKALQSLTKGLHKIKMPLFIGAVMHLVQYWGEIFHQEEVL
jgi:hypothetical protein